MKHIVLVDSDEHTRTHTASYLNEHGYNVTDIPSMGQLEFVKFDPDLLFIDVQCQLHLHFITKVLKESFNYLRVPIILMSESPLLKEYLIDIPIHAILLKPFQESELSRIIT
jgi:DNA-binding response OmpR family regulator